MEIPSTIFKLTPILRAERRFIINIDKDAPVPAAPDGHKWKQVIHDQNLAWVASWKDPISNENKYVYFAAEGQLKGKSDLYKYEKARKLNKYLSKIRNQYTADITSHLNKYRQLGTVLYLIDHHGIRVGNEKDESETDTVGASTLRIEHVKLEPPNTLVFDFLGKDSIRYYKEIPVDDEVYRPIGLGSLVSVFGQDSAGGIWTLQVTDNATGVTGTLVDL